MKDLIQKIKQKKELADIPEALVKSTLQTYLKKHNISIPKNKNQQKLIISEVRSELRNYTGRFQASSKKRYTLLKEQNLSKLLKTHASTKERLPYYKTFIAEIKKINPKSILDIGCGLNPVALAKNFPNTVYHALDIKESELQLIRDYFTKYAIEGDVHCIDIRTLKNYPRTDLTLVLKTFDIIETKGHKHATEILKKIPSKHIIASFATRTLSGKPMTSPRRLWFERLAHAQGLKFKIKKIPNEIFYIIERPQPPSKSKTPRS